MNINFRVLKNIEIENSPILINSNKTDDLNTVKDTKLGEVKHSLCSTCYETKLSGCNGHYGKLHLNNYIIINPTYNNIISSILKYYCYFCKNIKNPEINNLLKEYNDTNNKSLKKKINQLLLETNTKCLNKNCNSSLTSFKILQDGKLQIKIDKKDTKIISGIELYNMFKNTYLEFVKYITNAEDYSCDFTDLLFRNYYYIPSNYIREPNFFDNIDSHAHTSYLTSIVLLTKQNNKESDLRKILNDLDNSKGVNAYKKISNIVTLSDQVSGTNKDGIPKQYIFGRRLDNSSRCVLGPDVYNNIGTVMIPETIMNILTYRIYYNRITQTFINNLINNRTIYDNIKLVQIVIVNNQTSVYPNKLLIVSENKKLDIIHKLKYGDYIEIIKPDNTLITFSRQPSLHKWNIQSAKAYRIDGFTMKTNITTQSSQNADNDGDEENTTTPNSPAANVELTYIMNSKIIFKNPANYSVMYGLVQDQQIAIYNLYNKKDIPYYKAYNILGKYSVLIKNINKEIYNGIEILSLFIPNNLTYYPYFKNGILILPNMNNSYVGAQNYNSIFNIISQLVNNYTAVNLIDIYKDIAQNYILTYGYSIKPSDIFTQNNELSNNNLFVNNYINKINNNLNDLINDVNNNKINLSSYNDIEFIKNKNINNLQNILLNKTKEEILNNNNSLNQMTFTGYKRNIDEIIKSNYCMGQQGDIQLPTINGRISAYDLPGDISINQTGYISNSLIYGITYKDHVNHVKLKSMPNIINVTCGTSSAGFIGRKLVKYLSDIIINHHGNVLNINELILPIANNIKLYGTDIIKVNILQPLNKQDKWSILENELYNKIKLYLCYNKSKLIKNILFFINIDGEIETFNSNNNYSICSIEDGLNEINIFMKNIIIPNYYNLLDTDFIYYILISYLNPNRIKLSFELLLYIFNKIKYLLRYSLSPGTPIGMEYGHSIQENFTQETLSSFHSSTKSGRIIKKGGTAMFTELITLSMKEKPDVVTCYSSDYNTLINIKNIFEFFNITQLNPIYNILEEPTNTNNGRLKINIIVKRNLLKFKNINTYQYVKLFINTLEKIDKIVSFNLFPKISNEDINIKIIMSVLPNYKSNSLEIKNAIFANLSKGNFQNKNMEILKSVTYDNNLNQIVQYEISFYINSTLDLMYIDTSNLKIDLGVWHTYKTFGMFHSKLSMLYKLLEINDDLSLFNPYQILVSSMFNGLVPNAILKLKNKKNIIKNMVHGDNNIIPNAAFKNLTDPCDDIYSRILINKKINIGTGYFNIYINPNIYDSIKYDIEEEEEEEQEIEIINLM